MKLKGNQMFIVIFLLIVITGIVAYTWMGWAEMVCGFCHAVREVLASGKMIGL
ncbi:hypothetical protein [uncultured Sanguibacteroides sp.]|uniref:hypothetical protein n=1 Tax=uncultured Sanguibacteroides sp. TaxID=1635151 RepID=UPI002600FFDE|nr:hypothetical protein [uncultured Sanguibacteroides sp.]